MVLNRTTPATARAPVTARYAKNLGIDRNEQSAKSACVASAADQDKRTGTAADGGMHDASSRDSGQVRSGILLGQNLGP